MKSSILISCNLAKAEFIEFFEFNLETLTDSLCSNLFNLDKGPQPLIGGFNSNGFKKLQTVLKLSPIVTIS